MKLPCSVIQDLLPLYAEDLTSEISTMLVEEHLPECEDCKKMLEELKAPQPSLPVEALPMRQVKRLLQKQLWLAVVLTGCVIFTLFIPLLYQILQPTTMTYYEGLLSVQQNEDGTLTLLFAEPYSWCSAGSILDNDKTVDAREVTAGRLPWLYRFLHINSGSRELQISGSVDLLFFVNPDGQTFHLWGDIPEGYELRNPAPAFSLNDYVLLALIFCAVFGLGWIFLRKRKIGMILGYIALFFLCFSLGHLLVTGDISTNYQLFHEHFSRFTVFIFSTVAALYGAICTSLALYRLRKDR